MTTEGKVQLLTEGSGPKIRTLAAAEPSAVDSAGSAQADVVRHQQVVSLADRRGDVGDDGVLGEILIELQAIRGSLQLLIAQLD